LSKTHSRKFNYPFIWERWDLKDWIIMETQYG
jgi:hypothetical protein